MSRGASLFGAATSQFISQVEEVCQIGSNFIIDGTSANYRRTAKDLEKYRTMGYDCAMVMIDIDIETSQERNIARGQKGERSIWSSIIWRQGQSMPQNIPLYKDLFGPDRFFLVSNKGNLEEFEAEIEEIRPDVQVFMESK